MEFTIRTVIFIVILLVAMFLLATLIMNWGQLSDLNIGNMFDWLKTLIPS